MAELDGQTFIESSFSKTLLHVLAKNYKFRPARVLPKEDVNITREEVIQQVSLNMGISIYCGRDISMFRAEKFTNLKPVSYTHLIFDVEINVVIVDIHIKIDGFCGFRMVNCIFKQIDNNLFNESSVHGNHDEVIGDLYMNLGVGKPLAKPHHSFGYHLFERFFRLIDLHVVVLDSRDGQQIFHHIQKPVGIDRKSVV